MNRKTIELISYFFIAFTVVFAAFFGLATIIVEVLFAYFALDMLATTLHRKASIPVFIFLMAVLFCGFVVFFRAIVSIGPMILDQSIPLALQFAERNGISLPFYDTKTFREISIDWARGRLPGLERTPKEMSGPTPHRATSGLNAPSAVALAKAEMK